MSAKPRFAVPMMGQVLGLVVFTIVMAQAVTVAALFVAPPTPPPRYALADVARALVGGPLAESRGRPLRRRDAASLPGVLRDGATDPAAVAILARRLGRPEGDLRLVRRPPPPIVLLTSGHRPVGPGEAPPGAPPPQTRRGDPELSEFAAALRGADGRWTVVEPAAELEWARRLALWLTGGLVLVGPVSFWFARRIAQPLRAFAANAERLGRDPDAAAIPLTGPAEVGVAARAFNAMQERLARYVNDRVGMVGAVSHDLRTPLTRMRFKLEAAPEPLKGQVLADVAQMEQMVASVLDFIRESASPAPRAPLDLASLAACAVDDAALRGADAAMELEAPLIVHGDPVALRRLMDNLVDNAVRHGGRARVSAGREAGEAWVRIADDGPGLDAAEREQVFAPFHRGARAAQGGVGLGLPIARSVARAHGGEIALHDAAPGLIAEVRIPLLADT